MATTRMGVRLAASCLIAWGSTGVALALPTPAQLLGIQPKYPGAVYTTPSPQDVDTCNAAIVAIAIIAPVTE